MAKNQNPEITLLAAKFSHNHSNCYKQSLLLSSFVNNFKATRCISRKKGEKHESYLLLSASITFHPLIKKEKSDLT